MAFYELSKDEWDEVEEAFAAEEEQARIMEEEDAYIEQVLNAARNDPSKENILEAVCALIGDYHECFDSIWSGTRLREDLLIENSSDLWCTLHIVEDEFKIQFVPSTLSASDARVASVFLGLNPELTPEFATIQDIVDAVLKIKAGDANALVV